MSAIYSGVSSYFLRALGAAPVRRTNRLTTIRVSARLWLRLPVVPKILVSYFLRVACKGLMPEFQLSAFQVVRMKFTGRGGRILSDSTRSVFRNLL